MTTTARAGDPPIAMHYVAAAANGVTVGPEAGAVPFGVDQGTDGTTQDPGLARSACDIASAVIAMLRQFSSLKSRLALGSEGDTSPLFLLVRLAHLGPSRASDLAEQLCADPSTVSRQVASLVKGGLVERRADPGDGRASILVPTELGLAKVSEHTERRGAIIQPVIAEWSQRDRDDLLRLMTKYTEGIEAHREQIVSIMLEHHGSGSEGRTAAPHSKPQPSWKETH